jgi:Uma2 family endonuclease
MSRPAPADPVAPAQWTTEQYLRLVDAGVLGADDRVELLEGVIVSMAPSNVGHDGAVGLVSQTFYRLVGAIAVVRVQLSFVAGPRSLPEPDVAIVPGDARDYEDRRPDTALLIVEVADSSLPEDRLTKAAIYASAGVPEYWIVNLRDGCLEVRRAPDAGSRRYTTVSIAQRGDVVVPVAMPDVSVPVDLLLPRRRR